MISINSFASELMVRGPCTSRYNLSSLPTSLLLPFFFFFDAPLGTSGVWVSCGGDPYPVVDRHEWVISNELEPFSGESGDANLIRRNNAGRCIHRPSTSYQTILHQCLLWLLDETFILFEINFYKI